MKYNVIFIAGLSHEEAMRRSEKYTKRLDFTLQIDNQEMNIHNLIRYFKHNKRVVAYTPEEEMKLKRSAQPRYLNGIYLYDFLTKRDVNVKLINSFDLDKEELVEALQQNPMAVAISTSFIQYVETVRDMVRFIKEINNSVKIIIGGVQVFNSYKYYVHKHKPYYQDIPDVQEDYYFVNAHTDPRADIYVVESRGELTLFNVLCKLKNGGDIYDIKNIAYYRNGSIEFTEREQECLSLDDHVISWDALSDEMLGESVPLQGSIGCPFRCKFCNFHSNNAFQKKSKDILLKELELLSKRKIVKQIDFIDENLFSSPTRLHEICEAMIHLPRPLLWKSFVRADSIAKDNIQHIKESLCSMVKIGFESGDPRMLKNMNKQARVEKYLESITLLNNAGVNILGYFVVGFPGENAESLNRTSAFINSFSDNGPGMNYYRMYKFYLFPFSIIFEKEEREKYNLKGAFASWEHNSMRSDEVEGHIKQMFLSIDNAFFLSYYSDVDQIGVFPKDIVKKVFRIRQELMKTQLKEPGTLTKQEKLWHELEKVLQPFTGNK